MNGCLAFAAALCNKLVLLVNVFIVKSLSRIWLFLFLIITFIVRLRVQLKKKKKDIRCIEKEKLEITIPSSHTSWKNWKKISQFCSHGKRMEKVKCTGKA